VNYLIDSKGFTNHQVYQQIFCLYVYSRMPFNALVGVLSELPHCGASTVLTLGGICGLATAAITRFTTALWCQQAAQLTVAAAFASRYAVAAVAFALSPPSCFQRNIFMVRALLLLSNCCSALLGEVLRDAGAPLSVLFDVDLMSQSLTVLFAVALTAVGCVAGRGTLQASEAPRIREWLSVAEVAEVATAPPATRAAAGWVTRLKAPVKDLLMYFQFRVVIWLTVWALAANTAHGIVMTYWQNLLHEKGIRHDHNGYLLASMYFAASMLTAASRRLSVLRGHTSALAMGSVLSSGLLLCLVVASSQQLLFYSWLLLFQCGFEVMTAVSTFQVGSEVSEPRTSGRLEGAGALKQANDGTTTTPCSARLTLLFSVTGIICGITEAIAQAVLSSTWQSMSPRFLCLGLGLGGLAVLMTAVRALEEVSARRRRTPQRLSGSGRVYGAQATNGHAGSMAGPVPQAPLLPN